VGGKTASTDRLNDLRGLQGNVKDLDIYEISPPLRISRLALSDRIA